MILNHGPLCFAMSACRQVLISLLESPTVTERHKLWLPLSGFTGRRKCCDTWNNESHEKTCSCRNTWNHKKLSMSSASNILTLQRHTWMQLDADCSSANCISSALCAVATLDLDETCHYEEFFYSNNHVISNFSTCISFSSQALSSAVVSLQFRLGGGVAYTWPN